MSDRLRPLSPPRARPPSAPPGRPASHGRRPRRPTRAQRRRRLWALAALAALVLAGVAATGGFDGSSLPPPPRAGMAAGGRGDPFAWRPGRSADYSARAAAGNAHVLFAKSPGGVVATAARVAAYRGAIDRATAGTPVSPDLLEGLVFVESAGRPQVIAGADPAAAAGLTQILAETGQGMLGMHIDLGASRRLTRQITAAAAAGQAGRVARLQRRRAAADARFDPGATLAATVRYLEAARRQFGRADLAFESYHMGIGNLQRVLGDYDGGRPVPYVQMYFDSTPQRHAAAYRMLAGFGDDSELYWWRLQAAVAIMRQYRGDRAGLAREAALQTADDSGALALHPAVRAYADPQALAAAYQRRELVPLPANAARLGLAVAPGMGSEQAAAVGAPRALYRGLRPPALRLLIDLAAAVRRLSHTRARLAVAATVSDERSQGRTGLADPAAATGYTFAIERRYADGRQAQAFQAVLDRLQSLHLIAWSRQPATIEVTAASDAAAWLGR